MNVGYIHCLYKMPGCTSYFIQRKTIMSLQCFAMKVGRDEETEEETFEGSRGWFMKEANQPFP